MEIGNRHIPEGARRRRPVAVGLVVAELVRRIGGAMGRAAGKAEECCDRGEEAGQDEAHGSAPAGRKARRRTSRAVRGWNDDGLENRRGKGRPHRGTGGVGTAAGSGEGPIAAARGRADGIRADVGAGTGAGHDALARSEFAGGMN